MIGIILLNNDISTMPPDLSTEEGSKTDYKIKQYQQELDEVGNPEDGYEFKYWK